MAYSEPLGYFLTWTTYGTWLPGDERGSFMKPGVWKGPDAHRRMMSQLLMTENAITLDLRQRQEVEATIARHCEIRQWHLHAVNCRTNHVHVVVTAPDIDREDVMDQFKAWCTRHLKTLATQLKQIDRAERKKWWTRGGSKPFLYTDAELYSATKYVLEEQDGDRFKEL